MIRLKSGKKVIDIHAHFWATRKSSSATHTPHPMHLEYNRERSQRMNDEWDFPGPPEPMVETPEAEDLLIERWAAEVEKYDLHAVNFLTGSSNEELARVIKRYPGKFFGFAHHRPELDDVVEKFIYAIEELGLSGYKMMGPRVSIDWTDPKLRPLWTYMADKK
ncbi:MAG: amidohydrolase family protein, partial [Bacillota bacterium]